MLKWLFKKGGTSTSAGALLKVEQCWEVPAPSTTGRIAPAFGTLLPPGSVLVLEGTSIDHEVATSFSKYLVAPALDIRPGTIWPQPKRLDIGVSPEALRVFEDLLGGLAEPQICHHLYAYANGVLLLQWHDAFDDPIYLAGAIAEASVDKFCATLGVRPTRRPNAV